MFLCPKNTRPGCPVSRYTLSWSRITSAPCYPAHDPLQFAYRPNQSTDDAMENILHTTLSTVQERELQYLKLLFTDYCSVFNTIVSYRLYIKLKDLGINTSLCMWILDFLIGRYTSSTLKLNNGAPQGCLLSPLLYYLYSTALPLSTLSLSSCLLTTQLWCA